MSPPPSELRIRIGHLLDRLRRQGQEHAHTIRRVESDLAFLDKARERHLCPDIRAMEHQCWSVLDAVVQDHYAPRPLAEVGEIVGVSAEHLHALARDNRLPVKILDGVRHASVADARRALRRQRREKGREKPAATRRGTARPPESVVDPIKARELIRSARARPAKTRTA